MQPLQLGEIRIETVVETAVNTFPFAQMLPASDAAEIARHASWLEPRFADLSQGLAVLSFHTYLVRTPRHTVLVDTCNGNHKDRDGFPGFHMLRTGWLDNLRAAGVTPEQVDYVMCTHLHSDHIGWNTQLVDGRWVPTFPNAKYVFARREFEVRKAAWDATGGDPKSFGPRAYWDSVLPVVETGQALIVESDHRLDDHVSLEAAAGHTPGNIVIHFRSGAAHAICCGDTIHHPIQVVHPEWSSAFCEDPAASARTRRAFVERWADTPAVIMPAHFPSPTAGRIRRRGGEFRFEFVGD